MTTNEKHLDMRTVKIIKDSFDAELKHHERLLGKHEERINEILGECTQRIKDEFKDQLGALSTIQYIKDKRDHFVLLLVEHAGAEIKVNNNNEK